MTVYQSTAYRVRQLFSTLAAVTTSNPVLLEGERWHEKSATTGRFTGRTKTGDGVVTNGTTITGTAFNDLPFDPSTGGASLSDATPQALGTAAAGTGTDASRNDHRHAMPTAAQVGADATGTAAAAVAAHVAAADPHPTYATAAEAAAAAPVQSVAGRTGAVVLAVADVSGAVSSSDSRLSDARTPSAHNQAWSTITGTPTTLSGYGVTDAVGSSDSRLSDAREWSAATATQAEAEAGSSTTRLAFTPLRVFQAVAAWWAASAAKTKLDGIATGATANATDAQLRDRSTHTGTQAASTITGLATVATSGAYADLSGRPTLGTAATNIWIPAAQWIPATTNGCGINSLETTANKVNYDVLEFDSTTSEQADCIVTLPNNWSYGTVTARFYWTAASSSGGVVFQLAGLAYGDNIAIDTAMGTAQSVADTLQTVNNMHVSAATAAITIAGTPAANKPVQFQIKRLPADASDTLLADARLIGVEVIF